MPSKTEKPISKYNLRNKKYRKKNPPASSSSESEDTSYYSDAETIYSSASGTIVESHSGNETEPDEGQSSQPKFSRKEFQNVLAKMFPSKYMNSKIGHSCKPKYTKERESTKNTYNDARDVEDVSSRVKSRNSGSKQSSSSKSRNKKERLNELNDSEQSDIDITRNRHTGRKSRGGRRNDDEDLSDTNESESSESSEHSTDESDIEPPKKSPKKGENINIIFTIGKNGGKSKHTILDESGEEESDVDYFSDEDSYEESSDESKCNSEDEKVFMKETYQEVSSKNAYNEVSAEASGVQEIAGDGLSSKVIEGLADNTISISAASPAIISTKSSNKPHKHREAAIYPEKDAISGTTSIENEKNAVRDVSGNVQALPEDIESEYLELLDIKTRLSIELAKRPTNKILLKSVQECRESIRNLIKNTRRINTRKYRKLIDEDTKPINEMEYFKRKLSHKEQKKVMDDLNEIYSHIYTDKPYRLSLILSKMPSKFKAVAMQKLNVLNKMDPSDSEYYKIKNWVDTFIKIPFGIYKNVSVSMNDGVDQCNQFLIDAKKTLDDCTYGLNDAKMQIMQMLGQWMVNPVSVGSAIAIHGPMGTGKTTLVKEGISKILGREFAFIALGGGGDASFLEGHSYTYEGSTWGKIVQIIIDSKCMNPVIYFDELDKVSDTPRGQEIIGILTHLIDTSQNAQYHDKYFSEIDFDLSKCLFIFSYNDENSVNPILRDRMYHIRTKGYESKDKVVIARNYLLPKIREQVCLNETDVIIPDDMIQYIISTFTKTEMGVRNLKRCLEIIYSKLNLFRLVSADNKMFVKDMNLRISFPITITKKEIDVFIKTDDVVNQSMLAMYV